MWWSVPFERYQISVISWIEVCWLSATARLILMAFLFMAVLVLQAGAQFWDLFSTLKMWDPLADSVIWTRRCSIHRFQFLVDFHSTASKFHACKNVEQRFLFSGSMIYVGFYMWCPCDIIISRWSKFIRRNWGNFKVQRINFDLLRKKKKYIYIYTCRTSGLGQV